MSRFDQIELVDADGCYHVPDPQLLQLAEEIVEEFTSQRPQYAPGRVTIPRKALIKFYHAAELCREYQLGAAEFVRQQLEGMSRDGQFWPTNIANRAYLEDVDHNILYGRWLAYYKSQLLLFSRYASIYGASATLSDRSLQLSPLFRYEIALRYGLADIAEEYRQDAQREREGSPAAGELFNEGEG